MSTIRELRASDKNWHKLLYAYVHLAIELDFFSGEKVQEMFTGPGNIIEKHAAKQSSAASSDGLPSNAGESLRIPSVADRAIRATGCNAVVGGIAFLVASEAQTLEG